MRQFSILLVGILNWMAYIVICQENNKLERKDVLQDSWNYVTSHFPSSDAQSVVKNEGNGIAPAIEPATGTFADGNAYTPLIALQPELQSAAQLASESIVQPATIQPATEPASQPVADLPMQLATDSIIQSSKSASQFDALGNVPAMDSSTQNAVPPAFVVEPMAPAAPIPPIPPTSPELPSIQPATDNDKAMPEANNILPVVAPVVPVATYSPPLPPSLRVHLMLNPLLALLSALVYLVKHSHLHQLYLLLVPLQASAVQLHHFQLHVQLLPQHLPILLILPFKTTICHFVWFHFF